MKTWWSRCLQYLCTRPATVLLLQGGEAPSFFDPISRQNWLLSSLQNRPQTEWPVTPWDIRIGLDLHHVLCVPPMPGLREEEYPAYWGSSVQKAFPEHTWSISNPGVCFDAATILTAWPQNLVEALKPFDTHIQWLRPSWSAALAQAQRYLPSAQQMEVTVWIWEEGSRMLWMQRHSNPRLGWRKTVIRHLPQDQEKRRVWFSDLLEREMPEYLRAEEKPSGTPALIHLDSACMLNLKPALHTRMFKGWRVHTSTPSHWMQGGGM